MIDLHAHCLPGIDDGARDIDMALEMLTYAKAKGTDVVVATPHIRVYDTIDIEKAIRRRDRAYDEVMEEAEKRNADIPQIVKGLEVHMSTDVTDFEGFEKLAIEGTRYMLCEMPTQYWDNSVMSRLRNLKANGIVPVIAHIERYMLMNKNIEKILEEEGVMFQVNAPSLMRWGTRRFIEKKILSSWHLCVAGSDMHDMTRRKTELLEAAQKCIKRSPAYEEVFVYNPGHIVSTKK